MHQFTGFSHPAENKTLLTGFIFLGISFLLFAATINSESVGRDLFSQSFFVNYGLFIAYFIVLLIYNKTEFGKIWRFKSLSHNLLLLQLGNISAYALNRTVPVFQVSTDWLVHYLLLYNLALLLFILRKDRRVESINLSLLLIIASGLVFQLYETLYIVPFYGIGLAAFWFFGISLHVFIPLWFLIVSIKVVRQFVQSSPRFKPVLLLGIFIPLVMIGLVSIRWAGMRQYITENFHESNRPVVESELPDWVRVSRDLPRDWVSKRILKSGVVYQTADFRNFDWFPGGNSLNERRQHDPLVFMASVFGGDLDDLNTDDRLALLRTVFDQRHETERKLWRGDNLRTSDIVTNVQLFPDYRMAYTEKTIKINNTLRPDQWNTTQEALYTFYLPEGSVVTSAALWIGGEERPAYLTTKEKADSAYTAVVGYERRDPLLVHWQEGNRVTVRIFPCTPDEDRQFKIGITSPLQFRADVLTYHNIDFVGPNWRQARESINIVADQLPSVLDASLHFDRAGSALSYEGRYCSDWTMHFAAPALSSAPFHFNGKTFCMSDLPESAAGFSAREIYLDINRSWPKRMVLQLWEQIQDREVYVFTDRLERVTQANHHALFKELLKRNYGLFPLHHIRQPEQALVITASGVLTPTLDDLEGSTFATNLNSFMQGQTEAVKVFHLGTELSPYWKSLRELRVIDYTCGEEAQLKAILEKGIFPQTPEDEHTINNIYAHTAIRMETESEVQSQAPDHLMRLYVYNDLMRKIGKGYFERAEAAPELLDLAKAAYVLSPISSLIVLETQEDYDRFDIEKSRNSLQNASISLSGSVPEPHEWLLIVFSLLVAGWLLMKDFRTFRR